MRLENGGNAHYLHRDHLGSVMQITKASNEALMDDRAYQPFGVVHETPDVTLTDETKGYIGERYDASPELMYLNARYMDPALGMFIQPDWWEVTLAGVGTNRYSYGLGDPINLHDPNGNIIPAVIAVAVVAYKAISAADAAVNAINTINDINEGRRTITDGVKDILIDAGVQFTIGKGGQLLVSNLDEIRKKARRANAKTNRDGSIVTAQARLPQDVAVNPAAPKRLPTDRPIGKSDTQNEAAQRKVRELQDADYTDIRVNQQQVNGKGERVGINRPDVSGTNPVTGQRHNIEFDRSTSNRGQAHRNRALANDPDSVSELFTVD